MKAEHRKELHTNALASGMSRVVEGLKTRPNNRSLTILAFALLAIALLLGWRYYSNRSALQRSALWLKLDEAQDTRDLKKLADDNQGTMQARVARFQLARVNLSWGLERLCSSLEREEALKKIKEAGQDYEQLAKESRQVPLLAQEALMGAAKARESLGDLNGALDFYKQLTETYPRSALGKEAAQQAERVQQRQAQMQGFYNKLEQLAKGSNP
jgi:hypothetical protein